MRKTRAIVAAYFTLVSAVFAASLTSCGRDGGTEPKVAEEKKDRIAAWKRPQTCRECHAEIYDNWQTSHHALANREIDPERDAEAFAVGEVTDAAGVKYELGRDDDGFSIRSRSAAGMVGGTAKAVIGETPLQQFLIEGEKGQWQAHSLAWDPHAKEWFSVFGDEARHPGEWGHWTGQGMNWNANCASCHMTEYAKNYDLESDEYASSWTHQGISCIECHSGMDTHVAAARAGDYVSDADAMKTNAMDNCARCHSRREELTANRFRPGDRLDEHYRLMLADHPTAYFASGQSNEENFEYGSFMMSHMGQKGVSCMDCHDPHGGETILSWEDNSLCLRCHQTGLKDAVIVDAETHSGHAPGSLGAQCVACHMPERVYMERDARRDHGFTIPDPYLTEEYASPNACMDCHEVEGADWVNDGWKELFDVTERVAHVRERAKLMDRVRSEASVDLQPYLDLMKREQNPFWRAAWLRMLRGYAEAPRVAEVATQLLREGAPHERDAAVQLLAQRSDGPERIARALRDSSRLPRIAAASALSHLYQADERAFAEWKEWADFNSDWPSVALVRSQLAVQEGEIDLARKLIERAISVDPNTPELRYDAAILLDRLGLAGEALHHLNRAREQRPREGQYAFAIGLLKGGQQDYAGAAEAFAEAVELEPTQHRWWYNLAIAQARAGDPESAMASMRQAVELAPSEPAYVEFLSTLESGAP